MLREQDDPTSKMGKANDDSVLFPKRASRLDLFNRPGLSEIAERNSLRGSPRPPFASLRTESFGSDGYNTDEGSVISRSRPGEGNTMFGGRQKIFKIPVGGSGSVKHFGATEEGERPVGGNMGGKALYESDIAMSAFQKLREQERLQEREKASMDQVRSSKEEHDRSGSPPLPKYDRNRETASSTNSGPSRSRTSTAATSVASQRSIYGAHDNANSSSHALSSSTQPSSSGPDRPLPISRRLYGQGLDQHIHEQQSSALQRLESLNKSRPVGAGPTSRHLQQSRSATSLDDRFQRGNPLYASGGFRPGSPPPSGTPPRTEEFDLGLVLESKNNHTDSGYGRSPPLSPAMSPSHDATNLDATFTVALAPDDLGKATASGAFNKPKKQYNEQQYLQRQLQLQEGRGTPSPQPVRPFSPPTLSNDQHATGRSRNSSIGSSFSRPESVRHLREHHVEERVLQAVPERRSSPASRDDDQNIAAVDRSFLAGMSGSEAAEREAEAQPSISIPSSNSKFPSFSRPISQGKPANPKQQLNPHPDPNPDPSCLAEPIEEGVFDSRSHRSETTITQSNEHTLPENNNSLSVNADSPTLGLVGAPAGLSGLVRAHLRNDSGQSSIYPEESPSASRSPNDARKSIGGHESALNLFHPLEESWDVNEAKGDQRPQEFRTAEKSNTTVPSSPQLSFAARNILAQATALKNHQDDSKAQEVQDGNDKAQRIIGGEAPRSSHSLNNSTSWQDQLKAHHNRGASTETQMEREGLANEMAERRRKVQENLRTYVEVDSRCPSPATGARNVDNGPGKTIHPFGILKKTSKGSLVGKQERPSKAMKMLGMGPSDKTSEAPQHPLDMSRGRGQFSDRAMPPGRRSPPRTGRPQDTRQQSHGPPPVRHRLPGSGRSHENLVQRFSSRSSKSGSSYSDNQDRGPEASGTNPGMDGDGANGSNSVSGLTGYEPRDMLNAPRPADDLLTSMTRNGLPPTEGSQSAMSRPQGISYQDRSLSALSGRHQIYSKPVSSGHFEPRVAPPGTPFMINPKPSNQSSQPPIPDSNACHAPESRPSVSSVSSAAPSSIPSHSSPSHTYSRPGHPRKRSINKQDISEPTFLSCTTSVDTVNLPPGSSLSNGMPSPTRTGNAPPIPARDSRRKKTLLQALGRNEKPENASSAPSLSLREDDVYEERSTFSADDEPASKSIKQKLRKSTSEGRSMAAKARIQALQEPIPAVPHFELQSPLRQEHLRYQVQRDVPASNLF